jgi:integrase
VRYKARAGIAPGSHQGATLPRASRRILGTVKEVKKEVNAAASGSSSVRREYRIKGAPGLQLRVSASGTATWAIAYKSPLTRKWAKASVGRFPAVGLDEAKGRAGDVAADVRRGRDPIHDKRQEALIETFATLSESYMREHEKRNARAGRKSSTTIEAQRKLDQDILPVMGDIGAESVSRQHVMKVVEAIADRGSYVAADRALGLIRAIYNWACGTGRTDRNPTISMKKRNAGRAKTRTLSPEEIRVIWAATDRIGSITTVVRDALRLQLLTAARISEVLGAPRAELDLGRGLWTIAALRTKAQREHQLPLSQMAVANFRNAIERADEEGRRRAMRLGRKFEPSAWVFPSPQTNGPVTGRAATNAVVLSRDGLREAGLEAAFNTHDLRRTVATQLGEMGVADEIIERILNHAPRTIAGKHYNHARYLTPMRSALDAWVEKIALIIGEAPSRAGPA